MIALGNPSEFCEEWSFPSAINKMKCLIDLETTQQNYIRSERCSNTFF